MGLSVISSLPKGASPAAASPATSLTESLPGGFAALLSGELLGASGLISEISGKVLNTPGLDKSLELSSEALLGEKTGVVDPSILAALTGNAALPPEIPLRGINGLQIGAETLGEKVTEFSAAITDTEASIAQPGERKSSDGLGIFEKLIASSQRAAQDNLPGNETAIFAAETNPSETSNASLASLASGNLAIKQSREGLSADQSGIHTHLRESSWSQQFGEKIVWLAKNDQQSAQININPPELGPVQITLNLSGGEAKVTFASPHMEVRQAIENSLPQLKEMLSSAGINLGQTNVGANLAQQNPDNPYQNANGKHLADENAILPANDKALNVTTSSVLQKGRGLVDLFA